MNNLYVVYTLTIGNKIYVGATSNYDNRCRTHKAGLKKLAEAGKLQMATLLYRFVDIEVLKANGYIMKMYCYCDDFETANIIETKLIRKYNQLGIGLNVALTSGFCDLAGKSRGYKSNRRRKTMQQIEYVAAILQRSRQR